MNFTELLIWIWSILNSPAAITAIAGGLLWLLNRMYTRKPTWVRYEGTIIAAIKAAEKAIPDDVENKSLLRLNNALQTVLDLYAKIEGKRADEATQAEMAEGIQIIHAKLEAAGNLDKPAEEATA